MNNLERMNANTTPIDHPGKKKRRISLVTIFSSAFFSIFLLFMIVNVLVVFRFIDFQSILNKLSDITIPKVAIAADTYKEVNQLTYLTARLAGSQSQAFRRISYRDIDNKIASIKDLDTDHQDDQYLNAQLRAITKEFSDLNLLVQQKIELHSLLRKKEERMYETYQEILDLSLTKDQQDRNSYPQIWFLKMSEIMMLSNKALVMNRLSQVKQTSNNLKKRFSQLLKNDQLATLPNSDHVIKLTQRMEDILVSEQGLLQTRIKELRSVGQATGRNNFVHNLVSDYAKQVQFHTNEITHELITQTDAAKIRIEKQTYFIRLLAIFSVLFLIAIVYFLRYKIIARLVKLNHNVLKRLGGNKASLAIEGNDEISDIGRSFNFVVNEIEKQKYKLQELSLTDSLTGIANRRHLDQRLQAELDTSYRQKLNTSLLMIDVDFFKLYNDKYGHLAGDDCLQKITQVFEKCMLRKSDFVARYGGEEFVCILPDTNTEGAERIAQQILNEVIGLKLQHEWNSAAPYVTVSIGISIFYPDNNVNSGILLENADKALFTAKEKGKNRYILYNK